MKNTNCKYEHQKVYTRNIHAFFNHGNGNLIQQEYQ